MLYRELDQMKERPAMYGIESVEDIGVFITGYATAIAACNYEMDDDLKDFQGFQEWVKAHYDGNFSASWVRLIRYNSANSVASVDLFFSLLQNYRRDHS